MDFPSKTIQILRTSKPHSNYYYEIQSLIDKHQNQTSRHSRLPKIRLSEPTPCPPQLPILNENIQVLQDQLNSILDNIPANQDQEIILSEGVYFKQQIDLESQQQVLQRKFSEKSLELHGLLMDQRNKTKNINNQTEDKFFEEYKNTIKAIKIKYQKVELEKFEQIYQDISSRFIYVIKDKFHPDVIEELKDDIRNKIKTPEEIATIFTQKTSYGKIIKNYFHLYIELQNLKIQKDKIEDELTELNKQIRLNLKNQKTIKKVYKNFLAKLTKRGYQFKNKCLAQWIFDLKLKGNQYYIGFDIQVQDYPEFIKDHSLIDLIQQKIKQLVLINQNEQILKLQADNMVAQKKANQILQQTNRMSQDQQEQVSESDDPKNKYYLQKKQKKLIELKTKQDKASIKSYNMPQTTRNHNRKISFQNHTSSKPLAIVQEVGHSLMKTGQDSTFYNTLLKTEVIQDKAHHDSDEIMNKAPKIHYYENDKVIPFYQNKRMFFQFLRNFEQAEWEAKSKIDSLEHTMIDKATQLYSIKQTKNYQILFQDVLPILIGYKAAKSYMIKRHIF